MHNLDTIPLQCLRGMDQNAIRVADSRDIFQLSWSLCNPSFQNLQSSGDSCSDPILSTGKYSHSGDNKGHSLHPIICVENNTNMLACDKLITKKYFG